MFGRKKRDDQVLRNDPAAKPARDALDDEVLDDETLDEDVPAETPVTGTASRAGRGAVLDDDLDDTDLEYADLDRAGAATGDPVASPAAPAADAEEAVDNEEEDDEDAEDAADDYADEWSPLDEKDWRDDGPFDYDEVDLEADAESGVQRLDFGSLILTPTPEMQIQLQADPETQQVQAALAMVGNSAIEVAVFAAPATSDILAEIRHDMIEGTQEQGGDASVAEGPFGAEIRRVIPLVGPEGEQLLHVSRTWMVKGPRWLLRGVLMGEAGMSETLDGDVEPLLEFFRNLIVHRDPQPRVPGALIPMTLPADLIEQVQAEEDAAGGDGPQA